MALFSLLGKLGLDTSLFTTGLKDAEKRASSWASRMGPKLAGAFSVAAAGAYIKMIASAAGNVLDLADAYDLTTDKVQLMQEAASRNGVQLDQMLQSVVKIGEARQKAFEGEEKTIAAFARMGISVDDLNDKSKSNYDLLSQVAKTSSESNRNFQHQADLVDLIGAKGVRLVGAFRELQSLDINLVKNEDLKKVDAMADKIENLMNAIKRASTSAVGQTIGFFEATKAGDVAYAAARKRGMSESEANKEYSRAFLSQMGNMKLERINGKLVDTTVPPPAKPEYENAAGMPPGYTREGRAGTELMDVPFAKRKSNDFKIPSTGDLARIGGLSFGADYNLRLLRSIDSQVSYLSKIADATKTTADVISQ
jgi:hypothetical protein